jgi:hypothetical protein
MDNGTQILEGLKQTRNFLKQVALLIRTAEDRFIEKGWEGIGGKRSSDITSDYLRPEKWMPRYVYRFFRKSDEEDERRYNNYVIYIGVLLDPENAWEGFTEPWVTCGAYKMIETFETDKFNYWDWVLSVIEDKHEPDGEFHYWTPSEDEEEDEEVQYQVIMALPLIRITDAESLDQLIISPLFEEISRVEEPEKE